MKRVGGTISPPLFILWPFRNMTIQRLSEVWLNPLTTKKQYTKGAFIFLRKGIL